MSADNKTLETTLTITNARGLDARASAKFVKTAEQFDAQCVVIRDKLQANGHSIMGLMMLAAAPGTEILLKCEGPQAEDALKALSDLVTRKFDEE